MANLFFIACLIATAPLYSRCENHSTASHEIHSVAQNVSKINGLSNFTVPSAVQHVLNGSVAHSTTIANSTVEKKSALAGDLKTTKTLSLNSSELHDQLPSSHESSHSPGGHEIVETPSKSEHSTVKTPGHQQLMEGGGYLPPKKSHPHREKPVSENRDDVVPIPSTSLKPHKNISARKGAPVETLTEMPVPPVVYETTREVSNSTTVRPTTLKTTRKMKPLFTMVKGDKFTKESESFIESSTTGKDYVLPLVLIIFAIPAFIFLVKFLYKRGTEFTERQQYHRMYLIDGMYNTR